MKYFTGIDVSLRSVSICVVDEAGAIQYEAKVAAEVDLIRTKIGSTRARRGQLACPHHKGADSRLAPVRELTTAPRH